MKALGPRSIKCHERVGFAERTASEGALFQSTTRFYRRERKDHFSTQKENQGNKLAMCIKVVMHPSASRVDGSHARNF